MKLYKYELPGKMNMSGSLFAKNSTEAREKILEMHGETENLRLPIGTKIWEEILQGNAKEAINEIITKSMILAQRDSEDDDRGRGRGRGRGKKTEKTDKTTKKSDKTTKKTDVSPSH